MNKEIYSQNLKVISEKYPDIYKVILNYNDDECSEIMQIDNDSRMYANKDGKTLYFDSAFDNSIVTRSFFEETENSMKLNAKFLMFGLGNGMYARYFINNISDDHRIYIFEPSVESFLGIIKYYDISDLLLNDKVDLFVYDNKEDKNIQNEYFDKFISYTDIYTVKHKAYPNYDVLFKNCYNSWVNNMNYSAGKISAEYTLYENHGSDFVRNNYTAFKYIRGSKSLSDIIEKMPENVTTFVVGAGPSLKKNIHCLKKAKGRSVIIATDAAVTPLMKAGVIPDLMVCVDPTKGSEYITEPDSENIPLICGMNAGRGLLDAHKGIKIFCKEDISFLSHFFEKNDIDFLMLPLYGSVSTLAFSVARYLKSKKIVFVGQDLAYTGNQSHTEGSVRGQEDINNEAEMFEDDIDIYGNPIKSATMFKIFRYWFEEQIEAYPEVKVIDATEGGARIKGTDIKTLQECVDNECSEPVDFMDIVVKSKTLLSEEQYDMFFDYINDLPNNLNKMLKEIERGMDCYNSIEKAIKSKYFNKYMITEKSKEVNEILDDIERNENAEYVRYLTKKHHDEMLKTIYSTHKDLKEELKEICRIGKNYFQKLSEAIEELQIIISEMQM